MRRSKNWTISNKILPGVYIRVLINGVPQTTTAWDTPNTSATLGVAIIGKMILGT